MRREREEGHEVVGVCADGVLAHKVAEEGFRVHPVPLHRSSNPFRNLPAFAALRRLFRSERFDMLHVHTPVAGVIGRAAAAAAGVPRVVYTARSVERSVGNECVRTCCSRWSPYHLYKKTTVDTSHTFDR